MTTYIIRRLLLVIPTVFIVSVFVFLSVRFIPGDYVDMLMAELGPQSGTGTYESREAIMHALGLDVPIHVQYMRWIGNLLLHGSLGTSLRGGTSVAQEILHRLPVTFELGLLSIIIGLIISLPIGVYSAIRQDTIGDYVGRSMAIIFISVPVFWIGTMIMIYPSIWWGWAPRIDYVSFTSNPWEHIKMMFIPVLVLGMISSGVTMRMTRTMMLEVLRLDYIRTAWSKGLRERNVILRHALKNAFIPIVTIIGYQLPGVVGGAVIIEQIFVLPGMGRLMLDALSQRDYPIVCGVNLLIAIVVVVANLLVDITYAYLDPRVQYR